LVTFAVVMLLGAVPAYYLRRLDGAPRRELEGREITAVSALREGVRARVRGVVAACEPLLTSKIGGEACVAYHSFVFEAFADGSARVRQSIWGRTGWSSFLVTDETGSVVVKAGRGEMKLVLDADIGPQDLPSAAYDLMAENNVRMKDLWRPRLFKFRERLLRVGDRVSVVGVPARGLGAAAGGSSGQPASQVAMTGTTNDPVVVMDDDEVVRALLVQPPPAAPVKEPRVHGPSRRAIAERETAAVAALTEGGAAKIRGVASAREPLLTSPVSGRACIGYRITIERAGHAGSPVVRREAWPSFFVADDTGRAAVEGPFSILLDADSGGWADLPPAVYALLEEAKVPVTGRFGGVEEFQFHETLLEEGDRVAVLGRPSLRIDPAGQGTSREPPRLYVLQGSEDDPVSIVDDEASVG
jgi:hypothetical protein